MKFAHLADCHIGGWRDQKLSDLTIKAFSTAIDTCIEQNVDFVIIAGDLFNTSLPALDLLKNTVLELHKLKDYNIPVYVTPGSHDYSPSGKTFLRVLEVARLCKNLVKADVIENKLRLEFTIDKKTGAKLMGMLGKRAALEKKIYEQLDLGALEKEQGFKIFVFHSAITEFNTIKIDSELTTPLSFLPKNFNYYAGGHIHSVMQNNVKGYGLVAYPGPLFPNNFKELEELNHGGFYIYENGNLMWMPIKLKSTINLRIDATNKTPEEVYTEILQKLKTSTIENSIILLRVEGELKSGKPSDVFFKEIYELCYKNGAYAVMRNTLKLSSIEFKGMAMSQKDNLEEVMIKEHLGQIAVEGWTTEKELLFVQKLIEGLDIEKNEGERSEDYETRVKKEANAVLNL